MRIETFEREICVESIKKQTKCAKMTDETDPIIKNGINGAVGSCSSGGSPAILASRGNAVNSSSVSNSSAGTMAGTALAVTNTSRMQYNSSSGNGIGGSEGNVTQDPNTTAGHSGNSSSIESVRSPSAGIGGRLQFFKDGKFILELARSREGERIGWVSVPRKTYWPPSAGNAVTANSNYPKNESSTSLSFSDDNSSIQSSPWQRDHCWKQATPRRGISKEMCMFFKRTRKFTLSQDGYKMAQLKRRRPHDNTICKIPFAFNVRNGFNIKTELMDSTEIKKEKPEDDDGDCGSGGDGNNSEPGDSENHLPSQSSPPPAIKVEETKNERNDDTKRRSVAKHEQPKAGRAKLNTILEKLIDRLPTGLFYLPKVNASSGILNHFSTSVRISDLHHNHQQHVSPRKRILRELEKVSLEDNSTKRSRAKTNVSNPLVSSASSNSIPHTVTATISTSATSHRTTAGSTSGLQVSNGNSNGTETNTSSNSNRLYSSYSIHSLLANTSNSNRTNDSKEPLQDSSCLQTMLTSPNTTESYYSSRSSAVSSGGGGAGKRKSPSYSITTETQNHNRRSSRESPNNFGPSYMSESSLSPDPTNRYKHSTSGPTSFHPYLSSPKYSPSTQNPLNDYKQKSGSGYSSGQSPNHSQAVSSKLVPSSSSSSSSRSPANISVYSQQSPLSNKTSCLNNNNRLREHSPIENLVSASSASSIVAGTVAASSCDRRDGIPRTVPKKTVAFRQQYSSPTTTTSSSSAAASSTAAHNSDSSTIYKSPSSSSSSTSSSIEHHQKHRKNVDDQRSLSSPDSKVAAVAAAAVYQSTLDQLDRASGLMRASSVLPPSSYYYFHPPHNSPGQHSGQSPYIPPLQYYPISPYAAAVAALRNPLWMHYQAGLLPAPTPSRLPFSYNNGDSGLGSTVPQSPVPPTTGLSTMHLTSGPVTAAWPSLNAPNAATDDPVSLVTVKDEHNSDVPLNLSKH